MTVRIDDWQVAFDGLEFPECPRWHDGQLWFSDMWQHTVCRVTPGDRVEVVHQFPDDEDPGGLGWLPDGDLLVAGMNHRVVYRISSGQATVRADLSGLAPHQLNDMIVTADGTAFVSQFGFDLHSAEPMLAPSVVIRVASDGRVSAAADDLIVPNGIAVDEGTQTLVVAESGAGRLTRFALRDGELAERTEEPIHVGDAYPMTAPDGLCLDAEGARWVADSINNRVLRILDGTIVDEHNLGRNVLACTLGGHDRRTLFVCVNDVWSKRDRRSEPTGTILWTRVTTPGRGRP